MRQFRLAALFCAMIATPLLAQTTIHVGPSQTLKKIQDGIAAANNGDTVLVDPGTYFENIDFKGKAITVMSLSGPAQTTINGGDLAPTVIFQTGETRSSVISGFTITNGAQTLNAGYNEPDGGIAVQFTSPSILNNIITANYAHGIRVNVGAPLIQGNTISGTLIDSNPYRSLEQGSAIFLQIAPGNCISSPTRTACADIVSNIIENNLAMAYGPSTGIAVDNYSNAFVERNMLRYNSVGGFGSYNTDNIILIGNIVYGNQGGGINPTPPYFTVGAFTGIFANNLIVANQGPQVNFGYNVSLMLFVNNIVVGSGSNLAVQCTQPVTGTTPASFDHNDLYNATGTATSNCDIPAGLYGNLSVDPQFTSASTNDYHLLPTSPLIDAGNSSAPLLPTVDFEAKPRFGNTGPGYSIIDIGPYEYAAPSGIALKPQTTLTVTPSAYIQTSSLIQLSAKLNANSGIPQGTVTFLFDNVAAGSVNTDANGNASFDTSGLTTGTHAVTAQFTPGDSSSPAVSVKFYIQINTQIGLPHTTTTLTVTPTSGTATTTFHLTATVTSTHPGTPTGTVTFYVDSSALGTVNLVAAVAALTVPALTAGTHSIMCTYSGDSNFLGSSCTPFSITVTAPPSTKTTLSCVPTSLYITQNTQLSVAVTSTAGTPTGTLQLTDNGAPLGGGTLNQGSYNFGAFTPLTTGTHSITASYTPTGNFAASSDSCALNVSLKPTTLSLTSSGTPSALGQDVEFTATTNYGGPATLGADTGTVTFTDNGAPLGAAGNTSGGYFNGSYTYLASFGTYSLTSGTHTIVATLTPPAGYETPPPATFTQVVGKHDTMMSPFLAPIASPYYGQAFILHADVSPVPYIAVDVTGTVTAQIDGVPLAPATVGAGGITILPVAATLLPGTHTYTCSYSGDTNFNPSTCTPGSFVVQKATTAIGGGGQINNWFALSPRTFQASLDVDLPNNYGSGPIANAVLSFELCPVSFPCAQPIVLSATTDSQGATSGTFSGIYPGVYVVNVLFAGDALHAASQILKPFPENVLANSTVTSLMSSTTSTVEGTAISFTANTQATTGTVAPTGSIALMDGPTTVATLPLVPGAANLSSVTFTVANLSAGSHTLSAVYLPANPAGAPAGAALAFLVSQTTGGPTVTITPRSFTLTADLPAISIQTEHHGALKLTLTPIGNFNGFVQLSCGANLPPVLQCEFAHAQIVLNGTAATSSLTLETDAIQNFWGSLAPQRNHTRRNEEIAFAALLPIALLGLTRKRRRLSTMLLALCLLPLTTTLLGCGNKWPDHTPAGTYDIAITATGTPIGSSTVVKSTVHVALTVTP